MRKLLYANQAETVRVTKGFSDESGCAEFWLEKWVPPGEFGGWHWRYSATTIREEVRDAWVEHYKLSPRERDSERLCFIAADEWNT